MTTNPSSWAVAGAGLAGAMMAAYLADSGRRVSVYERRPDPRDLAEEGGRSINLALSHRGLRALDGIGIAEVAQRITIPMRGRLMHGLDGKLTMQPYGSRADEVILSISRAGLNRILLDRAEELGASLHFDHRVRDVDVEAGALDVERPDGTRVRVEHEAIIGADGAYSAVRARLQKRSGFDYTQRYLTHGYKELSMPPRDGAFAMDAHALHIWPRGGFMMIALPNLDASYTCTLFWPLEGPNGFSDVQGDDRVLRFFNTHFPDVPDRIPDLTEQYRANPIGSLLTIRCHPWNAGRTILIGDAAHAVVPFYGQGMNASFEDCRLLMQEIERAGSPAEAFARFQTEREPDTDALADLAIHNYTVMRDRVASRGFLLGKAAGRLAHRLMPGRFTPLYTMVTFTSMPYAEARDAWLRQRRLARRAGWVALIVLLLLAIWIQS